MLGQACGEPKIDGPHYLFWLFLQVWFYNNLDDPSIEIIKCEPDAEPT